MSDALCYGCFNPRDEQPQCSQCGFTHEAQRSPLFLPLGTLLAGQYRVGRILGEPGGFGITYLGWDEKLRVRVAIKEYLPKTVAGRAADGLSITVHTDNDREAYEFGREKFLAEARTIAQFRHPNIVVVRQFFEANNTAYMVMDYYEGQTLAEYLSFTEPKLPAGTAIALIRPILDGLAAVHERSVLHRDVKPSNIYLASIGQPILIDFSAAREASGFRAQSMSVVLTEGYAPIEQYQRKSNQGPWTDVYAAGATLFRMMTGEPPPISIDRLTRDPLRDMRAQLPHARPVADVLARAMAVNPADRIPSAEVFLHQLEKARERLESEDDTQTGTHDVTARFRGMRQRGIDETQPGGRINTLTSDRVTPHKTGLTWVPIVSLLVAMAIIWLVLTGLPDIEAVNLPTVGAEVDR